MLSGVASRRGAVVGERVLARLREGFVEQVLELPIGVVESAGTGDLTEHAPPPTSSAFRRPRAAPRRILIALVTALLTAVALVADAPLLGLALLPAAPLLVAGTRWYLRRAPDEYRRVEAAYARCNSLVEESAAAGRSIEALGLGPGRVAMIDDSIAAWLAGERATLRLRTVFFPIAEAAYVVPLVLAVAGGGLLHIAGRLSLGAATAAAIYAQQLIDPVNVVISWLDELELGLSSLAAGRRRG